MKIKHRLYRLLGIVSPGGAYPTPATRRARRRQGMTSPAARQRRVLELFGPAAAEGLADGVASPSYITVDSQSPERGGCWGDCDEPLLPRVERCPETDCTDAVQCWRCDAEEAAHRCKPSAALYGPCNGDPFIGDPCPVESCDKGCDATC